MEGEKERKDIFAVEESPDMERERDAFYRSILNGVWVGLNLPGFKTKEHFVPQFIKIPLP